MPYKNKSDEIAFRKRWWASLSKQRKREKQEKANARNRKVKEFLAEYKMKHGCSDCGYKKHHSALEFDHIGNDKMINVCFAKSINQAKKEILKCEVVCSNCHRIRTYNRIHPCKPDIFEAIYELAEKPTSPDVNDHIVEVNKMIEALGKAFEEYGVEYNCTLNELAIFINKQLAEHGRKG